MNHPDPLFAISLIILVIGAIVSITCGVLFTPRQRHADPNRNATLQRPRETSQPAPHQ
jgi:hypothetical protein